MENYCNDLNNYCSDKNIICFYHENEEFGCLSNWYKAEFEYAGERFSSVEQYMMYHKVLMFHEFELAEKIMVSDDPATIKKLGRTKFPTFNGEVWDKTCYEIVKRGVRAKFEQNPDLLEILVGTKNKILAEASLKDTKWGIGIAEDDPNRYTVKKWKGRNLLGRILMEVRDELRKAKELNVLGYVDAHELDFAEWHMSAGELCCIPQFRAAVKAYGDTLRGDRERDCFYHQVELKLWEVAMRTNMGGGLPVIGFYEMKQDIFDIIRMDGTLRKNL